MQRIASWIIGGLILASSHILKADEIRVIETRRNIPLTDEEPRYMDFYLNGGSADGIKKNQVVKVIRHLPVRNAQGTQEFGTIRILVGEMRVIQVDARTAIGRLYRLFDRDELPVIDSPFIMIGDQIDLSGTYDYKKRADLGFSQFD